MKTATAAFVTALLLCAKPVLADSKLPAEPLWEAGVVGGGVYTPDYPAASTSHFNGIGLPYVTYRGRILRADQTGLRGRLALSERVELSLGFAAAFPARSKDNPDRVGMADLGYMVEAGPSLNYTALLRPTMSLRLLAQARAAFAVTGDERGYQGLVLQPEISFRQRGFLLPKADLLSGIWARFGQDGLNRRYYEVSPADVTASRPLYQAHDGYLQSAFNVGIRYQLSERLKLYTGAQFALNQGAANQASPLYRRSTGYNVGFALQYRLFASRRGATDPD